MKLKVTAILFILILGIALGVGAVMYGPDYIEKYLPKAVPDKVGVEGKIEAKRLEHDRLLLTVLTPDGAILVTFRKKVSEIDLLVEDGDYITLGIRKYKPFIDDPGIIKVRKEDMQMTKPEGETTPEVYETPEVTIPEQPERADETPEAPAETEMRPLNNTAI